METARCSETLVPYCITRRYRGPAHRHSNFQSTVKALQKAEFIYPIQNLTLKI